MPSCAWWRGTGATPNCSTIPASLLQVGVPVAELLAYNLASQLSRPRRIAAPKSTSASRTCAPARRTWPSARFGESVVEIRGNPMPGGGFVATFTDVTAFRRTEAELKGIAETLEQRVVERTAELEGAKGEAERANRAKTPFPGRGQPRPGATA